MSESAAPFAHARANHAIELGGVRVALLVSRSPRRTIGLTVSAAGLAVGAPLHTPLGEIDALLRTKSRWIVAKLTAARERQAAQSAVEITWRGGGALPFLGRPLVLRLDAREPHGRGAAVLLPPHEVAGTPASLQIGLPADAPPEAVRAAAHAWLTRQARRWFTARLDHFAPQLGVRWQRLALTSAATRWGSASTGGAIRLNWRLMHLPEPLIDYVVVHELAHLREMNHGPRFWAHVASICPEHVALRRALRAAVLPRW